MMSRVKDGRNYSAISVALVDLLILHMCFVMAYFIKFAGKPPKVNFMPYFVLVPVITIVFIVLFNIYGLYTLINKNIGDIIFSIFLCLIILQLVTVACTFFVRGFAFPRTIFIIAFFLQFIFLSLWRYFVQKSYKKTYGNRYIMIFGEADTAERLARKLIVNSNDWYDIKYIINSTESFDIRAKMEEVDVIYICSNIDESVKSEIIKISMELNKHVMIVPEFEDILFFNSKLVQVDDLSVISINGFGLTIEQKFVKRVMDIMISLFGIIITLPFMLITALLVKITSPGPILYKQVRLTEGNREFEIYKFRTMYQNAEKMSGPVLASEDDPRITKLGKILRSIRFDELPQFFNVLKGDMSFIGPRPERPYFVEQFKKEYPEYEYRHNVKAGITGLAQVMGKYSTDFKDKLRYDLIYIKNYSFLLDIKIMFLTVKTIFTKNASAGVAEDKSLDELLKSMDYNVYNEAGVTKLEREN